MHFMHIVFGIVYFFMINIQTVDNQEPADQGGEEAAQTTTTTDANEDTTPEDKHTFVALIDIVFTDASKRSCTGAVIHNNVVLTAAHCFIDRNAETLLPELTLSFVVIGTRKMFEAAYEQYLPIERVVSHPKFKGWTADLALVFTFAGMTSDKPGQIIPLAGAKTQTPVDSNVTVLSWGRCRDDDDDDQNSRKPSHTNSDSDDDVRKRSNVHQNGVRKVKLEPVPQPRDTRLRDRSDTREDENESTETNPPRKLRVEEKSDVSEFSFRKRTEHNPFTTPKKSRYIFSESIEKSKEHRPKQSTTVDPFDIGSEAVDGDYYVQAGFKKSYSKNKYRKTKHKSGLESFKNWRRQMGSQKNDLTVEVFGFVNVQACKKIVERTMPAVFSIKNVNEILCYSSEDRYITNEDSGAPALHNGNLVAVTVGGVETDGDHVAIGMKMSCFCPWIAENLPDGDGNNIQCCQNCCDTKHFENEKNGEHDDDQSSAHNPKKMIRTGKKRKPIVRFDDGNAQEMFDRQLNDGYFKLPHTAFPPAYMPSYPPMAPRFKSGPQPQPEYFGPSNSSFRSWYYV